MNQIIIILLSGILVWVLYRSYLSQRIIQKLHASLLKKKRYLLKESSSQIQLKGLEPLVQDVNALIDYVSNADSESSGFSNQVEITLSAIQEAVFILNQQHEISYANESAETIFNFGASVKKQRLESVVRSPALLELLSQYNVDSPLPIEQISVDRKGEQLWFEASISVISKSKMQKENAILLVLHDITMLKKLEMLRKDFVTNVSHELRTPITIIKGFSETLVDDSESLSDEAKARFFVKIKNNIERLHLLVEDLFTLSRLESQPEQIEYSVQSLERLFIDVKDNYTRRLVKDKQSIQIVFDSRIEPFAFDAHKINQVLDNLIENSFRYAPEFKEITIKATLLDEDNMIECSVSDDGPGIPEKNLPHIFERFYRVDKGRSREEGGTGLGLSILKHIILLHGGAVRAKSILGEGAEILFTLPYRKALDE